MKKMTSSTILVALLLTVLLHGRTINQDDFMEQGGDDFVYPPSPMTLFQQLNYIAAVATINQINSQNNTYIVKPNQFAILSPDERKQITGLLPRQQKQDMKVSLVSVPPQVFNPNQTLVKVGAGELSAGISISWRNETLAVRNQGICGSCWAFTGLGLIEQWQVRVNKTRFPLSPEQILNCNKYKRGCGGGFIQIGLQYAAASGLTRESQYPYTGTDKLCKTLPPKAPLYKIKGFDDIGYNDCLTMIDHLKKQMVGVAVAADDNFMFYSSGILTNCGSQLNHAVILTGYISNATANYYVIRNSWGTGWGEKGYMRISTKVQGGNLCGICTFPTIAVN